MSIFNDFFHVKQSPILSMLGFGGGGTGISLGGPSLVLTQFVRTFTYTGTVQDYTVPDNYSNDGVQSIQMYVWGAGGGASGGMGGVYSGRAGCGGFAEGLLLLTAGTSCKIIVGQGGNVTGAGSVMFGGGGADPTGDGAGGGLSGLFETSYTHGNSVIIAGGGGGSGGNGQPGKTYYGGCGGGTNGEGNISQSCDGSGRSNGGTQVAAGQGGSALQGGGYNSGYIRGGAGGGGYYGGGCSNTLSGCGHPGGGGGSGYLHSSKITSGSFSTLLHSRGNGAVPESSNTYYQTGVGNGPESGGNGGNGLVVIVENVYA